MTAYLGNSSEATINLKNWTKRRKNCLLMFKNETSLFGIQSIMNSNNYYFSRSHATFTRKIQGKISVTGFVYR